MDQSVPDGMNRFPTDIETNKRVAHQPSMAVGLVGPIDHVDHDLNIELYPRDPEQSAERKHERDEGDHNNARLRPLSPMHAGKTRRTKILI